LPLKLHYVNDSGRRGIQPVGPGQISLSFKLFNGCAAAAAAYADNMFKL